MIHFSWRKSHNWVFSFHLKNLISYYTYIFWDANSLTLKPRDWFFLVTFTRKLVYIWPNGIIFHQPRFPERRGFPLLKPPFGVRSCEVAIIWQDINVVHNIYIYCFHSFWGSGVLDHRTSLECDPMEFSPGGPFFGIRSFFKRKRILKNPFWILNFNLRNFIQSQSPLFWDSSRPNRPEQSGEKSHRDGAIVSNIRCQYLNTQPSVGLAWDHRWPQKCKKNPWWWLECGVGGQFDAAFSSCVY